MPNLQALNNNKACSISKKKGSCGLHFIALSNIVSTHIALFITFMITD